MKVGPGGYKYDEINARADANKRALEERQRERETLELNTSFFRARLEEALAKKKAEEEKNEPASPFIQPDTSNSVPLSRFLDIVDRKPGRTRCAKCGIYEPMPGSYLCKTCAGEAGDAYGV